MNKIIKNLVNFSVREFRQLQHNNVIFYRNLSTIHENNVSTGIESGDKLNTEDTIKVDKDGEITIISLNRPTRRNAVNRKMSLELCKAISNFENDNTSRVGVLYGIGGSFSSGYDMLELSENLQPEQLFQAEGAVGPTRRFIKKPMVCGISGFCIANGLELALMCDLRVIEEDACLGFYNRRFGIPLMDGGTIRLPALIGLSRALDLILTGRSVSATEAMDIGLAHRLVATGTALGQAVNLANCLAKFPQATLNHDRVSLYEAAYEKSTFDNAIQNELMIMSKDVFQEMTNGAEQFKNGIGRGGKTANIKDKIMPDWEFEEYKREVKYKEAETKKSENIE